MRFNESHEPHFSLKMLSKAVDLLEMLKYLSNRSACAYPILSYFAYIKTLKQRQPPIDGWGMLVRQASNLRENAVLFATNL